MGARVKFAFAAFALYTIVRFGIVAIEPPGLIPTDFGVLYTASQRLIFGPVEAIYNAAEDSPYKYSPTFLLFFRHTFGEFSIQIAWTLWCALSIGLFLSAVLWLLRSATDQNTSKRKTLAVLIASVIFGWHGYLLHFSYGQGDMIIFSLFLFAARLSEARSSSGKLAAGFLLALQLVTKPQTGLLLLYFALRKRWDVLTTAFLGIAFLLALPALFWGQAQLSMFLSNWVTSLSRQTPEFMSGNLNQSLAAVIARWLGKPSVIPPLAPLIIAGTGFAALVTRRFWMKLSAQHLATACLLYYCLASPLAWRWLTFLWAPIFFLLGMKEKQGVARIPLVLFCLLGILLQSFIAKAIGIQEPDNLSRDGLFAIGNLLLFVALVLQERGIRQEDRPQTYQATS